MRTGLHFMAATFMVSCSMFAPNADTNRDVQIIRIFFHTGRFDEFDTFRGTYQKDLIPGIASTSMWLTEREQEIILTKMEQVGFFSLPDTIYREPNVGTAPDFGPQVLRISYRDQDKTVVWYEPMSPRSKSRSSIEELKRLLKDIIFSKPEYKALPPTKGGYI